MKTKTYDELLPLVLEAGEGVVITHADCEKAWGLKEKFPTGDPDYATALAEMIDDTAAQLVGVIFEDAFTTTVEQQACESFDQDAQEWSGTVEGFRWEICVDGDEFLLDISSDEDD